MQLLLDSIARHICTVAHALEPGQVQQMAAMFNRQALSIDIFLMLLDAVDFLPLEVTCCCSARVIAALQQMGSASTSSKSFLAAVRLVANGCQQAFEVAELPGLLSALTKARAPLFCLCGYSPSGMLSPAQQPVFVLPVSCSKTCNLWT